MMKSGVGDELRYQSLFWHEGGVDMGYGEVGIDL